MVSGSLDTSIRVWDAETGAQGSSFLLNGGGREKVKVAVFPSRWLCPHADWTPVADQRDGAAQQHSGVGQRRLHSPSVGRPDRTLSPHTAGYVKRYCDTHNALAKLCWYLVHVQLCVNTTTQRRLLLVSWIFTEVS